MKQQLVDLAEYASLISAIVWMVVTILLCFLVVAVTQAAKAYTKREDAKRETLV